MRRVAIASVLLIVFCFTGGNRLSSQKAWAEPVREETQAPTLTHDVKTLPAAIHDLVVGGSGRYLVLHFAEQRKLAVFDLQQERITFTIPLGEDDVFMAAGQSVLVVVYPASRLLQTWNLATGKREKEALLPIDGVMKAMAMGASSDGPLLVTYAEGISPLSPAYWSLLNPDTLAVQPLPEKRLHNSSYRDIVQLRAAGNGRLFGIWATSHSPTGLETVTLEREDWRVRYLHKSGGHVIPNHDGRLVFTGIGVYTNQLQFVPSAGVNGRAWCIPAQTGPLFLAAALNSPLSFGNQVPTLQVRAPDQDEPLALIDTPKQTFDRAARRNRQIRFTLDKRVVFSPLTKRIVVVPVGAESQLYLYTFDAEQAIEQRDIPTLAINSQPPLEAERGRRLSYRIDATTTHGRVTHELAVGPSDMDLTKEGLLTWNIPAQEDRSFVRVIITVSDDSGTKLSHGFVLKILSPADDNTPRVQE